VKQGEDIAPGARFGLIRFGSRTDVYVATDSKPLVAEGQRAIGGETVLIDLKSTETQRHFRIA
jgi:phosphatidylserine decarboxylase